MANWICFNELGMVDGRYGALPACIDAIPTDGLGISESDLQQLGASTYAEVDKILKAWLTDDQDAFSWDDHLNYPDRPKDYEEFVKYRESLKDHPVVQRHLRTEFKRKVPINLERRNIFKEEK